MAAEMVQFTFWPTRNAWQTVLFCAMGIGSGHVIFVSGKQAVKVSLGLGFVDAV